MKLISFAVPCYNSAAYMDKCIRSLLKGGDDVEIIIVDDGSKKDDTAKIADDFAAQYPDVIKAVHQENGGHGEAVNTGLKNAQGVYFKVVDSDDWVDEAALKKVIDSVKSFKGEDYPDALVVNYVYEHVEDKTENIVKFNEAFPEETAVNFEQTKKFPVGKFLAMHALVYRTEFLKEIGLKLPKHTFYVDNIFVYTPLPYVKSFYYINADFYRYFIGREDQSVNEKIIMSRIDQHIRVTEEVLASHKISEFEKSRPKLFRYMLSFISIMMTINSIYLIKINTKESLEKKKALWQSLKEKDEIIYKKCKKKFVGMAASDNKFVMWICKVVYKIARAIFKFN